jgi:DNA-binding response OmpR family regulator
MDIIIVGGRIEDERRIEQLGASTGIEFRFRHAPRVYSESAGDDGVGRSFSGRAPRAIVVAALDQPELGLRAVAAIRGDEALEHSALLVAVSLPEAVRLDPAGGFDDFVIAPFADEELYARLDAFEWRRDVQQSEGRLTVAGLVVDKAGHEVRLEGRPVRLTQKEFRLLTYLCERRGRVLTREQLLSRVWGNSYGGGLRTVDIHVRRLRAKLGAAFPLETLRGSGYKLRIDPITETALSA